MILPDKAARNRAEGRASGLDGRSKQVSGRGTEKEEEQMSPLADIVLLATDGSGESDRAARMAVELSRNLGSELRVIQVAPRKRSTRTSQRRSGGSGR
jgi:hypothetical protein